MQSNLTVMVVKNFDKSLLELKNGPVRVTASNAYPEPGMASVQILFANGTRLRADYWRLTKDGGVNISSFDHEQQYGLPAPIDAIQELKDHLGDKVLIDARLDKDTGDLLFQFADGINFRVLNFTAYEVWEITLPGFQMAQGNIPTSPNECDISSLELSCF